jgi:hypothetical protein
VPGEDRRHERDHLPGQLARGGNPGLGPEPGGSADHAGGAARLVEPSRRLQGFGLNVLPFVVTPGIGWIAGSVVEARRARTPRDHCRAGPSPRIGSPSEGQGLAAGTGSQVVASGGDPIWKGRLCVPARIGRVVG